MLLPKHSITDSLKQITKIPIFFIHGTSDRFVPFKDFISHMWEITKTDKIALITPFDHLSKKHASNMTNWGIYKYHVDDFIRNFPTHNAT